MKQISIYLVTFFSLSACLPSPSMRTEADLGAQETASEALLNVNLPSPQSEMLLGRYVLGRGSTEVYALLGKPDLARKDPPAHIWQYLEGGCVLSVFLYDGPEGAAVRHLEARNKDGQRVQPDACLTAVAHKS